MGAAMRALRGRAAGWTSSSRSATTTTRRARRAFRANWLGSLRLGERADGLVVAGTLGNHDVRVTAGATSSGSSGCRGATTDGASGTWSFFLLDSNQDRRGAAELARLGPARAPTRAGRSSRCTIPPTAAAPTREAAACGAAGCRSSRGTASTSCSPPTTTTTSASRGARRHLRRPRRRRGRALLRSSGVRAGSPGAVEAHKVHGWLYIRANADRLRVRAIGRGGRVRDAFTIYP